MSGIVVAIDGPAGAGKSTVSRRLAQRLGYRYVDTGAMYRVIGVLAARRGVDESDAEALAHLCDAVRIEFVDDASGAARVLADGTDLTEAIRTPEAAQQASRTSTVPVVRDRLVARQRALGAAGGVVMEGRDIGTVVFPDAPVKAFLDASPRERARRRAQEHHDDVTADVLDRMEREIAERDERDRGRTHAPLRPAEDAILLDTTDLTIEEVVDQLARRVEAHSDVP